MLYNEYIEFDHFSAESNVEASCKYLQTVFSMNKPLVNGVDRKSAGWGKRVDLGGRRIFNKIYQREGVAEKAMVRNAL